MQPGEMWPLRAMAVSESPKPTADPSTLRTTAQRLPEAEIPRAALARSACLPQRGGRWRDPSGVRAGSNISPLADRIGRARLYSARTLGQLFFERGDGLVPLRQLRRLPRGCQWPRCASRPLADAPMAMIGGTTAVSSRDLHRQRFPSLAEIFGKRPRESHPPPGVCPVEHGVLTQGIDRSRESSP